MLNILNKEQMMNTLEYLCSSHQKVLDKFTKNKFISVDHEDQIKVCSALSALAIYRKIQSQLLNN